MKKEFDYLIVGAGLFGLASARMLTDNGYKCLVIDKRDHVGGNCYTENVNGINVHKYGPHIFHTNNDKIWNFINKYTTVNNFTCRPKLIYGDDIFSFPINLLTMHQIWGVKTPKEAMEKIATETEHYKKMFPNPKSSYESAMSNVGPTLYKIFYEGYLKKQWGCDPKDIPAEIIQRQTFRLHFDDNYYYDKYQGIPNYTLLFENLLKGSKLELSSNFLKNKSLYNNISDKIIYTGPIDSYFDYVYGNLEYRSLTFKEELHDMKDYQGTFMMSYPEEKYDFTRIIEHKHFEFGTQDFTIITKEYPSTWDLSKEPYYPVNNGKNKLLYGKYLDLSVKEKNVYFGGRMGTYSYINMDETINNAIKLIDKII